MSSVPAVWLGQRSYSIYLAHWPLIVFWKISTDFEFSLAESGFAMVASVLLGTLLYQCVERPFRSRKGQQPRFRNGVLVGILALGVGILASGAHLWGLDGVPSRIPPEIAAATKDLKQHWDARMKQLRTGRCNFTAADADPAKFDEAMCATAPAESTSYLVLGDSFASDAYLVLSSAYPETYFGQLTVPGCLLRLPQQITQAHHAGCRGLYEKGLKIARRGGFDGVILSSNWQDGHYYRIDELVKSLERPNFRVIVMGQRIRFKDRIPTIVATSLSLREANQKAFRLMLSEPERINRTIIDRFSTRVEIFDMYALQRNALRSVVSEMGEVLYLDDSHVSIAGALELGRAVRETHPDLFSQTVELAAPLR